MICMCRERIVQRHDVWETSRRFRDLSARVRKRRIENTNQHQSSELIAEIHWLLLCYIIILIFLDDGRT